MSWVPRPSKWRYYVMVVVVQSIGRMPLSWRYGIAHFMADRIYDWGPRIGPNVRSNIRHVLGPDAPDAEVDRISRECTRNTGRYYADVIGMHRMNVKQFLERDLSLDGLEYIREARKAGHGVVVASAHYGNPEFALQGVAAAGLEMFAMVEPLEPPELGDLMRRLRSVHGHHLEPISFTTMKKAITWLRKGGAVAILIDRDIQKRGIELNFCGYPAHFPTGAVDLALRTNAVLLPSWVHRVGGYKIKGTVGPPMPLIVTGNAEDDRRVNTQRLLNLFEKELRSDPGQWAVLDRIWPGDVPARSTPGEGARPPRDQAVQ